MSASFLFTTLEEFLFWEDRPAYPWSCFIRLHFSGPLDRRAFENAVRTVLPRHPLFCAKARMRSRTHVEWVVQDDPQPIIRWESGPLGGPFPAATHLDLLREIGIRFHIVSDGRASDVVIQFHHACCDGIGICAFVDELLIAYALALGAASDGLQLPPLDPARLALRGRFGLTLGELMRVLSKQAVGLLGIRQFLMRAPAPLLPHQPCDDEASTSAEYPAVLSDTLEVAQTAGLCQAAIQRGVRLNDVLATRLFLALTEWRSRHGVPADGWLRMMVPVNLRTPADRTMPAVSLASSIFLDRRRRDGADAEGLLRSIHEEMNLIRSHRLSFTFAFFSRLLNLFPGELKRRSRAPRCAMSCIFSNVGRLFEHSPLPRRGSNLAAGNLTLEASEIVAPIRPYTCAAFVAATYANRLTITLHYDPRPLSHDQATDLLETFLRRLQAP